MEIHKPKAWHGWREFAKELGTIVAGILIALGLEQAVVAVHERTIAQEAREAVRAEVRENLWWLRERETLEPCVRRRLVELEDVLAQARKGQPIPLIQHLGDTSHQKITDLRWRANAQAGRASLFSGEEQQLMGEMYFTTDQFVRAQDQEEAAWAKLAFLQGLTRLSPQDLHDFAVLLGQARRQNETAVLDAYRARQWAQRMGLSPANPGGVEGEAGGPKGWLAREQICQPLTGAAVPPWPWEAPEDAP